MSRIRLICPNCGAQYEVPLEVIPEGGRDVQCSNCAHTWFQQHPEDDPVLQDELEETARDDGWSAEEERPEPASPPTPGPETEPEEPPAHAPQRGLDPQVAEVLREEAELERRQREAEAASFEMQTDLGLAEPDEDAQARRAREARERMARIRGEDLEDEAPEPTPSPEPEPQPEPDPRPSDAALAGRAAAEAAAAAAESRRELLPDVEEINQTLRSSSEPRVTDAPEGRVAVGEDPPEKKGGSFARGFFFIVVLAAIAIGIYASAPQIKGALPQAAPLLDAYVAKVDTLRLWLDGQSTELMQSLDGMSSENQPAAPEAEGN